MRSAIFLAACFIASTIALGNFPPAKAQVVEFQAPQGEARQRLIRRALGIPESSTITQIAEVTPGTPIVRVNGQIVAMLSAWGPQSWMPASSITIARASSPESSRPRVTLDFRAAPGMRHLVICEIERHPAFDIEVTRDTSTALPGFTWETPIRGALLIAPSSSGSTVTLNFRIPEDAPANADFHLSRCTISAISA